MSLRRHSALMFGSRIVAFVMQAASGLLLARLLGPAGRGELALLLLLPTIAAMILSFGMGPSNAYFASQARARSARELPAAQLFGNSLWMGMLLGVAGIVSVAFGESWVLATFMRGIAASHVRLAMTAAPLLLLFAFLLGLAQGEQRFGLYNAATVLRPSIFLLAFLLFLATGSDGVRAGLWAFAIAYALCVLWLVAALRPGTSRGFLPNARALRAQMRIGLPAYVAELLGHLFLRANLLLIGYYLDREQAGYFAIVLLVAETLWFLANSVSAVLLPVAARRSPEQLRALVPKAVRHVVLHTACSMFLLLLIDRWLITLGFGDDFEPSVVPLRLLYPGILAASAAKIFSSYLLSQGRPQLTAAIGAVGMVTNLLVSIWLIPLYGTGGASLAVSCSYLLMTVMMAVWFVWSTNAPPSSFFWFQREDLHVYTEVVLLLKAQAVRLRKTS